MQVAVLSDIHANRHALEAVLADVAATAAREIWCLGDVVGYGADPNDCVDLVRDSATVCLTADGVLLRAQGRGGEAADSSLLATKVEDAPQSPSLFRMPSGGGMNLQDVLRPFLSPNR